MDDRQVKNSKFQFTQPGITHLIFDVNKDYDAKKEKNNLPMRFSVKTNKSVDEPSAVVSLTMKIGEKSNESPLYIEAEIEAQFIWEKDLDENIVEGLLKTNAVSLLIGYLRPLISQITVQAGMPSLNIPFIDLR